MPLGNSNLGRKLDLVRRTVARELEPQPLPGDDTDLAEAGLVDSMTRVNILLAVEETTGAPGFAAEWPDDRPFSVWEIAERLLQAGAGPAETTVGGQAAPAINGASEVSIRGWAATAGSITVPAEQVDAECGFVPGFLRDRTGIETVCRASNEENEVALAVQAAESALEVAGIQPADVDLLVGVSTTHLSYPSFAAGLHAELLLRESVGAVDVGGACCGVLYALAAARSLLPTINGHIALVVASEINSRRLASVDAPAEFRALFGDAACAFVLEGSAAGAAAAGKRLRAFAWGANGTFASALAVTWPAGVPARVEFRGEQLAAAAIDHLERALHRLASMSGLPIEKVDRFALHEPNPRVLAMLARKAGIPLERASQTARTWGNVGSVTCGANLCKALTETNAAVGTPRPPSIFAAAVGPGLLWGGVYIG